MDKYDRNTGYTAYITYADNSYDKKCANLLYRAIKQYKVPGKIARLRDISLKRIYLESEDAVKLDCMRKDEQINLHNSEFLIIVCSPETRKSERIRQEIGYFKDEGRNNKILVLLVKGEPGEVFPEELIQQLPADKPENDDPYRQGWAVEPLAANIEAASMFRARRKLATEKLRIICRFLNCSFDDLKQRYRERQRAIFLTICSASIAAFAILCIALATNWLSVSAEKSTLEKNRSYLTDELNYNLSTLQKQFENDPAAQSILNRNSCDLLRSILARRNTDTNFLDKDQLKKLDLDEVLTVKPYDTARSIAIKASIYQRLGEAGKAKEAYETLRNMKVDDYDGPISDFVDRAEAFMSESARYSTPCGLYIADTLDEKEANKSGFKEGDIIIGYSEDNRANVIYYLGDIAYFNIESINGEDVITDGEGKKVNELQFTVLRMNNAKQIEKVLINMDKTNYINIDYTFRIFELFQ